MMQRVVEPEWLDELPADDARAIGSRADLRRLNSIMNHARHFASVLRSLPRPNHLIDIGAGDGVFTLRVLQKLGWSNLRVTLIDRCGDVSKETLDLFRARGCEVNLLSADVYDALRDVRADVAMTNLFLHHFPERTLRELLVLISASASTFVACEPRRGGCPLLASRLLGIIGCNAVTRHDAPVSVRAGFRARELSELWPDSPVWGVQEHSVGMFSHLFMARRL